MPNPRDAIIEDLERQLAAYFAAGGRAQEIPRGVGVDTAHLGASSHHNRLRGERDKLAPAVKARAEMGCTASQAAKSLGIHIKRVTLIAQENGFKFADTP
ncbi:hypothetical protein [Pseudomonas agarici]|uniref:hypothetical protein n=1 Tax=Pseudomonas agarici TaxID=46677 RepID=UPI001C436321|nr:hypothetical protein [Pseudomonas agarici]